MPPTVESEPKGPGPAEKKPLLSDVDWDMNVKPSEQVFRDRNPPRDFNEMILHMDEQSWQPTGSHPRARDDRGRIEGTQQFLPSG